MCKDKDRLSKSLNYMIIGAGGTGGAIGAQMAHAGRDVTFIARGKTLDTLRTDGIRLSRPDNGFTVYPVKAFSTDDYPKDQTADVIFVCVKAYSVDDILPFIEEVSHPETVVIPIINVFGTGGKMQESLPAITVLDGCIYIWTELKEPGFVSMGGTVFRIVYGLRRDQAHLRETLEPVLLKIKGDLESSGIEGEISENIERDALVKFSYVSPQGAAGLYYNVSVEGMQKPGEIRDCFIGLVEEICNLADAMGIGFTEDVVAKNLKITDTSDPVNITSMQRDVAAGRRAEIDGLVNEVVRMGEQYNVPTPLYNKIAKELNKRGIR